MDHPEGAGLQHADRVDFDRRVRLEFRGTQLSSDGGHHRPDGSRHPRRHPPIASATVMRMTAIRTKTKRKRQDKSARCAEKLRRWAGMLRLLSPIRTTLGVWATTDAAGGGKRLINWRRQAMLTSEGRPLGECRVGRFTLDDVDADGSSFVPEKRIDFTGRVGNEKFCAIDVECVDLSAVIGRLSCYDKIVLKLDIEGAEYEVLERLLSTGALSRVSKLYVEWHWQKCGMGHEQHVRLVNRVKCVCPIEEWDAHDMAIHNRDAERAKARGDLARHVLRRPVEAYQKMRLEGIDG